MLHVEIIVETVFDRWAIGELGIRPKAKDGSSHNMGTGMAEAVDVGHLSAFFESLTFVHERACIIVQAVNLPSKESSRSTRTKFASESDIYFAHVDYLV